MRAFSGSVLFVSVGALVLACGSANGGNGVNDVKLACEARSTWTKADSTACSTCIISAYTADDCDCKRDEYRGLCNQQLVARNAEADCEFTIDQCVSACAGDCDCVDGCYANHPTCKPLAAAYEGCLADVCEDACK